jgi:hypothetical protein
MQLTASLVLIGCTLTFAAQPQATFQPPPPGPVSAIDPTKDRVSLRMQAYGFVRGQQLSLERISQKFPDLSLQVKRVSLGFQSCALGEGFESLRSELAKSWGSQWGRISGELESQLATTVGRQTMSRDQCTAFIAEVENRARGIMDEKWRAALLSSNRRYAERPELEFAEGWRQTFTTRGHPKAKGVDLTVSLPASWQSREGARPNVIQAFDFQLERGHVGCSIMVKQLPQAPTKEEAEAFFLPEEMKEMLPDGATFVEAKQMVLDGSPAGMLVLDQSIRRLDFAIQIRMTQFVTIQRDAMIFIQFATSGKEGDAKVGRELSAQFMPLFRLIANSLVLSDKYR